MQNLTNKVQSLTTAMEEIHEGTRINKSNIDKCFKESAKADILKGLSDRFEVFSEIENIHKLETSYLPKIRDFTGLVDQLEESHASMKECIRKFDEDLSLKASKIQLHLQKEELVRDFIYKDDYHKLVSRDM